MVDLVIKLPPEVAPYEHDLRRFVDAMVYKLKLNARKGRWDGVGAEMALTLLFDEVAELQEAVKESGNTIEILLECADVGNFALIMSSITVEKGNDRNDRPAGPIGEGVSEPVHEGGSAPRTHFAMGPRAHDPEAERR